MIERPCMTLYGQDANIPLAVTESSFDDKVGSVLFAC